MKSQEEWKLEAEILHSDVRSRDVAGNCTFITELYNSR